MGKCRHKKGLILASANYIEFTPDQEPFEAGILEDCGMDTVDIDSISINIHYCPKCQQVKDIEVEQV